MQQKYSMLKGRIIERYGSYDALAEALGVEKPEIEAHMEGSKGFSAEEIEGWSTELGIPIKEIDHYFF